MLALGILSVVTKAMLYIALVAGGAYALTTYGALPGLVDALIWLAAGGYAVFCVIVSFTVLAALTSASQASDSLGR